jgi:2-methylcitrate dehydratase PrpD
MDKGSVALAGGLCAWASTLTFDRIPHAVVDIATECLIDTLGAGIAAWRARVVENARSVANLTYADGYSEVLGQDRKMAAPGAAFLNGTAAHAYDFDDNGQAGMVHGTAVVAPAALASVQEENRSGKELLLALVAGLEVEYALALATGQSLYARGWFTSSIFGVVGAAVAAGRAMGLNDGQMTNALSIALVGAGGMKACVGTDAKPLLVGRAAEAGVMAARLARAGAGGPPMLLEDRRGFFSLLCGGEFDSSAIEGLGKRWGLHSPGIDFKRAPVCLSAAAALDGFNVLRAQYELRLENVERVVCDIPEAARANLPFGTEPRNIYEAQFSLPFVIGCALAFGDVELHHLDESILAGPDIKAAMGVVDVKTSQRWHSDRGLLAIHPDGAFVTVRMRNGNEVEHFCSAGIGTVSRPMNTIERRRKFLTCARSRLSQQDAQALLLCLETIAGRTCVRGLLA